LTRILVALLTACACATAGAGDEVRLPDIGSSAGTLISPLEERAYGESMLRELRKQEVVVDDPLMTEYIESLGYRLVAVSDRPEQEFTFFVLRSPEINAFAAPGGYVGVYTGLITTAESESELAAVLAHEAAHVTQKHLVRAFENVRNASIPIALAMLGALIAAQASGSNDAAQAAVVGGTALMQQQQINFTRHNEYEADRIGIHTLAEAEFEPQAMATFFGRMGRALRSNGSEVPELLRTHPVTTTRISEAKARADSMPAPRPPVAGGSARGERAFLLFRERARVIGAPNPPELVGYYQRQIGSADKPAWWLHYGLGQALIRANRADEALSVLRRLAREQPEVTAFALATAEAESRAGQEAEASRRLARLAATHPDNLAVVLAYSERLLATGQRDAGTRAMSLVKPLLVKDAGNPLLQLAYARSCQLAGFEVRAGEAHAEVALLNGRFDDALQQLNGLLKRGDIDYYERVRIEARIAEITPYALEQRRRAVPVDA
jgi:predicted Zn-dependent protease